jgi:hypothetical protein
MTEMNEREATVIDEDGANTVKLIQPVLGVNPFVLLHCDELDPNGSPVFSMKYGGGLTIEQIPSLLQSLLDNLSRDLAAGMTDDAIQDLGDGGDHPVPHG